MKNKNKVFLSNNGVQSEIENKNKNKNEANKNNYPKTLIIVLGLVIFIVLAIFVINTFCFSFITVSGSAMDPTINDGEMWLIDRTQKDYSRNDIITFYADEKTKNGIVSRVIAVSGDTIYIDFTTGDVYVNNVVINEPYAVDKTMVSGEYINDLIISAGYGMSKPIRLGDGELFVMGDNRSNSRDSREFGPVEVTSVFGVARSKIK